MTETPSVLIVGGGPAGLSAARAYRAAGGAGGVLLLSEDDRPPYLRPPLSKGFLRGESGEEDLPLEEASWYAGNSVEVRTGTRVAAIDPAGRTVRLADGLELGWERLLLATGSEPVRLPVPGARLPGVHLLRTARDALSLREAAREGRRAVVVGSGFIGCEAAASLAARGVPATIVTMEEGPQAQRLGAAVAERLAAWLAEAGVEVVAGAAIEGIERDGDGLAVATPGRTLPADLVLMAAGARPRIALAEDAGLAIAGGAVRTDPAMRTSADGVWCAGDPAMAENPSAGRPLRVEHWGEALAMGEVAGRSMAGADAAWDAVPGFWSTIGERTIKQAAWGDGWDETELRGEADGSWTAWYGRAGRVAGVLAHGRDDEYGRGTDLVRSGALWPPPA